MAAQAICLGGGEVTESQAQLGQQGNKFLVLQLTQQRVDGCQLNIVHQQQIPGGAEETLEKGRGPQLLIMGAPEIPGGGLYRQILLFRRAAVEKAQGRAVESGVDGILGNQFLQGPEEYGAQIGKGGTGRNLIEQLAVLLNGLHPPVIHRGHGSICRIRAKHRRSRAG